LGANIWACIIFDITVTLIIHASKSQSEGVSNRHVEVRFTPDAIKSLCTDFDASIRFVGLGCVGVDIQGAGECVSAIQRSLRASKKLNCSYVEKRSALLRSSGLVNTIDKGAHDGAVVAKCIGRVGATNIEFCIVTGKSIVKAWYEQFKPGNVVDTAELQCLFVEGRNRYAHVLQAFFALFCSNHNLFKGGSLLCMQGH